MCACLPGDVLDRRNEAMKWVMVAAGGSRGEEEMGEVGWGGDVVAIHPQRRTHEI